MSFVMNERCFSGIVIRSSDSRHALIDFLEIGQKKIPVRFIVSMGGAVAKPLLRVRTLNALLNSRK